jgi:hypothetical protein
MNAAQGFYCLMSSGVPLTPPVRDALYDRAQFMLSEKMETCSLDMKGCWGSITNSGKSASIGGAAGVRFEALVTTPTGNLSVSYIIRQGNVPAKDITWV